MPRAKSHVFLTDLLKMGSAKGQGRGLSPASAAMPAGKVGAALGAEYSTHFLSDRWRTSAQTYSAVLLFVLSANMSFLYSSLNTVAKSKS